MIFHVESSICCGQIDGGPNMANVTVKISAMSTRVTLQSPTIAEDAGGAQKPAWTTEKTVWAERINAHGDELIAGDTAQASQTAQLRMRYYNAVLSTWRVLIDGQAWQIIAPPDHIRDGNRYTELLVRRTDGTVE